MFQYERELAHMVELKRQNMHLFVEAARTTLQQLWDELYFSEEQMAEFTPAFAGTPPQTTNQSPNLSPRWLSIVY